MPLRRLDVADGVIRTGQQMIPKMETLVRREPDRAAGTYFFVFQLIKTS